MKKNFVFKIASCFIVLLFIITFGISNIANADTFSDNGYWALITEGKTGTGLWGSKTLKIETYVDDIKLSGTTANRELKFANSGFLTSGVNPGSVDVIANSKYYLDSITLDGVDFNSGDSISINNGGSKTLRINLSTKIIEVKYTINYYVNSIFQESETKTTTNYDINRNATVIYKSAAELNLTSDYKVKGPITKIIQLDLTNSNNNIFNIFYTNAKVSEEDPWKRTTESKSKILDIGSNFYNWNWTKVKALTLDETNQAKVWDGAHNNYRYYNTYSNTNLGFEYATWIKQYNNKDMRRFQTVITVPEGYDGNDFVRMKSVNQDSYVGINNGNIVPINDNIFVFVYPEKEKNNINDSNYLDYLAFWSGTVSQGGSSAYFPNTGSNRILGNKAIQIPKSNANYSLIRQTDGWYVEATVDNIGEKLAGAKELDRYVVDIFTQDYAEGGGMDKFIFEFVKNKAPKADDDVFVTAIGTPINKNGNVKPGVLNNDFIYVQEAGAKAEIYVDRKNVKRVTNGFEIYDNKNVLGGRLTNFDSNTGTFTFEPVSGYMGVLKFSYECYQKKVGQDVIDPKLKDTAEVSIYVLPSVTADHRQAEVSGGKIANIVATSTLKSDDVIYGWPSNLQWSNEWVWPENEAGINRPADKKSVYEVSSFEFPNYNYIGYRTESKTNIVDTTNKTKTLTGNFSSSNKNVGFYYEKGKSNLIVECYIKGTDTLLKRDTATMYSGSPYDVTAPTLTGYTYDSSNVALSGTMPSNGLVVKLYYTANLYNYTVEYYFNDIKTYELTYIRPFGSKITSYLKAEDIDALANKVTEGYLFVKDENVPLTIDTGSNIIKVYYEKRNSELNWFYMYPNVKFDKDKYIVPTLLNDPSFNEYGVIRGFDYTLGFNFNAAKSKPNITFDISSDLLGSIDNFRIYDENNNLVYPTGNTKINSLSSLLAGYNFTLDKNYTIVFGVKYNKVGNDLRIGINGDIKSENIVNKVKLNPYGIVEVE